MLVKMRSYWRREGPESLSLVSLKKGKFGHSCVCKRMSCEDEGRDQGDAPISNECHRSLGSHQKPGERRGAVSSSQPTERHNPADT